MLKTVVARENKAVRNQLLLFVARDALWKSGCQPLNARLRNTMQ